MDFDFNDWMELAQRDPEAFENRRKATIKDAIDRSKSDRRLMEGLQFRLDMARRRSSNPMAACIRLHAMMMDYFHSELRPALQGVDKKRIMPLAVNRYQGGGKVTPFQKKRSGKAKRQE